MPSAGSSGLLNSLLMANPAECLADSWPRKAQSGSAAEKLEEEVEEGGSGREGGDLVGVPIQEAGQAGVFHEPGQVVVR